MSKQFPTLCRSLIFAGIFAGAALTGVLGTAVNLSAQALRDVKTPDTPLVLKTQGSFFIGGEKVEQTQGELGDLGPGGHITVNQMYVRYMVPQGGDGNVPVVMVHGATLTGKSWETTPDGRMGWDEYFVRKAIPCMSRTRSGGGDRVSIKPRSTAREPARRRRLISLAGSGSATRSSGRTSASVRSRAIRTRTVSPRDCRGRTVEAGGT